MAKKYPEQTCFKIQWKRKEVDIIITEKKWQSLKWDVQKSHMRVKGRCPQRRLPNAFQNRSKFCFWKKRHVMHASLLKDVECTGGIMYPECIILYGWQLSLSCGTQCPEPAESDRLLQKSSDWEKGKLFIKKVFRVIHTTK